jgi:hypothetical protein
MAKPWFMFTKNNDDEHLFDSQGFVVPFGDPGFDVNFGGAHDLDINPPPNYPVTALLPGRIASITKPPPDWGEQIGVELDEPFNGIHFMAYLHLSAVNPDLAVGQPILTGHIIGWAGGANTEAQYAGTSNPTGRNFTNPSFHSSQVQVGVALMRGKEFGLTDFNHWPPVERELDPSQIIYDARKAHLKRVEEMFSNGLCVAVFNSYFVSTGKPLPIRDTGIFNDWRSQWINGNYKGCCLSDEYPVTVPPNGDPGVAQNFAGGTCVYNNKTKFATWL